MSYPTIGEVKELVDKHKLKGGILLFFDGQKYGYVEYGRNKLYCRVMKAIADQIYKEIEDGDISVEGLQVLFERR